MSIKWYLNLRSSFSTKHRQALHTLITTAKSPMMDSVWTEYINDLTALFATMLIFVAYYMKLRRLTRQNATSVLSIVAAKARASWVSTLMTNDDTGILAVQTLRNSSMAASFFASTAVLLIIGVLTLSAQSVGLKESWHVLNLIGSIRQEVWLLKLLSMLLLLFFAFFCFTNAIRILNIVGYMINARNLEGKAEFAPQLVSDELNRGGRYFSFGMRAYYFTIPLVCWLFGPLYMVSAAIILVTILLPMVDRV